MCVVGHGLPDFWTIYLKSSLAAIALLSGNLAVLFDVEVVIALKNAHMIVGVLDSEFKKSSHRQNRCCLEIG